MGERIFWWFVDALPWWILAIGAGLAVWWVHRTFGWRAALAVVGVALAGWWTKRTYERGQKDTADEYEQAAEKTQERWDEIDREHTDTDAAYDHLRGMQHDKDRR